MPFFKSLPDDAAPPTIFAKYPDIYGPWSTMSQALMNGPSALSQAERELILAYAAGVAGCDFVYVAHSEVAYAWGMQVGLLDELVLDLQAASVEPRLKTLLSFVRQLMLAPASLQQSDADAVFDSGWDEGALHDAICISARAAFMQRLVEGHHFTPLTRNAAAKHAKIRVERGYVNLYRAFRQEE